VSDNSKLNFPLLDWLDEEDRGEKGFTGYNLKFDEAFRVKDALNAPATSSDVTISREDAQECIAALVCLINYSKSYGEPAEDTKEILANIQAALEKNNGR